MPLLFLIISALLFSSSLLHADTTWVAGEVWGTWTREGNPYLVTDTLIIPLDSTLQIMPGVEIWFQDQEIRRTPIHVLGRLLAIGEESDSIYFLSPNAPFSRISNQNMPDTEIRLEYCVIDSMYFGIMSSYGSTVVKRSRINARGCPINNFNEIDTVQHCDFESTLYVSLNYGGPSVFQYNRGTGLSIYNQQMAPIFGNRVTMIAFDRSAWTEVYNNDADNITAFISNVYVHDNIIRNRFLTEESIFTFERNMVGYIDVDESQGIVRENVVNSDFIYALRLYSSDSTRIERNLLITNRWGIYMSGGDYNLIQNNTIIFGEKGVNSLYTGDHNQIVNNIFVGDEVSCTGIYSSGQDPFLIRYNDFHNVTSVTYGCELDTGNIFLDPCFRAGSPYDYQLQANSPCIDAGDPSLPLDPDSTRADMGCYFFDHSIDNPPAIISPVVVNVQRGTLLRYMAQATDDNGPLQFGFWDLPDWLHEEALGLDWMEDSTAVSGTVPLDQDDFTFGVWVEDGAAQRDSQEVSVLISPYTILAGEVTGVLTRERSPYMVVEDVVVPAGDSLRIEPGVEIRFQWEPVEDLRHRIVVRGMLNAIGTREDTIRFLPEYGDSLQWAWRGIWCLNPVDTTHIRFAYLLNAKYGVQLDSGSFAHIKDTGFYSPYYGVYLNNGSWVSIDSCDFRSSDCQWGHFIYVNSASATVTNSHFEFPDTAEYVTFFNYTNSATGTVSGCTFSGGGAGAGFNMSSQGDFIGNCTNGPSGAIGYANGAFGIFANNIRNGARNALLLSADVQVLVSNNVFHHGDWGI